MPRILFHIDMDSYFASVEQQALPSLRGRPVAVSGRPVERSIVVAASREAKRHGVTAGMPIWEAERLCPSLVFVPGCAARYISVTKRFLSILERYAAVIEVYSIDEVFMDVTQEARRYGGPVEMARAIQTELCAQLGEYITATIGIASGRTFAKLIGARHKPNGIGWLRTEDLSELLRTTPVGEVCGIGPRIARRLHSVGIRTLAELGEAPTALLRREFGVYGVFLREIGQGRDPTPVISHVEVPPPKSVGHSRSLPPALRSIGSALLVLRDLCDTVARRMRKLGFLGRTVHCGVRVGAVGPHLAKQVTLPAVTDDDAVIYAACLRVLDRIGVRSETVAQVGVSVSNLVPKRAVPCPLLPEDRRREEIHRAVDRIRDRYGEEAIRIGTSLLYSPIPPHVGGYIDTASGEEERGDGGAPPKPRGGGVRGRALPSYPM